MILLIIIIVLSIINQININHVITKKKQQIIKGKTRIKKEIK